MARCTGFCKRSRCVTYTCNSPMRREKRSHDKDFKKSARLLLLYLLEFDGDSTCRGTDKVQAAARCAVQTGQERHDRWRGICAERKREYHQEEHRSCTVEPAGYRS